jgi:hypothetical protein
MRAARTAALALALVVAALVSAASVALAEPVQEVNVQLANIKPDGRYTVVFSANSYDTSGAPPPLVTKNTVRLPAGISIKPQFLSKQYQCKVEDVRDALLVSEPFSFKRRLDNLPATLKRTRKKLTPKIAKGVEKCIPAEIGKGSVLADTRAAGFTDDAPAHLFLYMAKPTAPGAKTAFGVLVVLDENSNFIKNNPFLKSLRLIYTVNIFDDPTPDGLYGYRLDLPAPGTSGVRVSLAELTVRTPGITAVKSTAKCLLKNKKRKCVKRKVTKTSTFWVEKPTCPASGQLSFEAFYQYETGAATTKTVQIPCPRFEQ